MSSFNSELDKYFNKEDQLKMATSPQYSGAVHCQLLVSKEKMKPMASTSANSPLNPSTDAKVRTAKEDQLQKTPL